MSSLLALALPIGLPLAKSSEGSKAGPIGLAVILLLCIACYFLFKSMSKHLRKVREQGFGTEAGAEAAQEPDAEGSASSSAVPPAPATPPTTSDSG